MKRDVSNQKSNPIAERRGFTHAFIAFMVVIFAFSCSDPGLKQSAEAGFRITLNSGSDHVFTDAELDSMEKDGPWYCDHGRANKFYDLLVKKGFASSNGFLDTTGLGLHFLDYEKPRFHVTLSGIDFTLDTDDLTGRQTLEIKTDKKTSTIEFKPSPDIERWVSVNDLDDNGKKNIIILEKYYIVGGYNFDLKLYDL